MNSESRATVTDIAAGRNGNASDSEEVRAPQLAKMPWYPRDFASSTRGWPLAARGAYRELLDAQWDMGSLPLDPQQLRAIAAATPAEWRSAWPLIERKFPLCDDDCRRNPRLEVHRAKAEKLRRQHQSGAASTNVKRYGRH